MPDGVFQNLYFAGFIIGSVVRKIGMARGRGSRTAHARINVLDSVLVAAGGVGLIGPLFYLFTTWFDFADYAMPLWAAWAGAPLFAGGQWLLHLSHRDLGKNWSPRLRVREGHTLVTGGIYAHIRHPMYAAHFLWAIGQLLLLHNWIAGPALLVALVPLYLYRVPREEQLMLDEFGDEYRDYSGRTGRMLPRWPTE